MSEQAGRGVDRDEGDVRGVRWLAVLVAGDVGGVTEHAGHVGRDLAQVELPVTGHAGPVGAENVRAPCGVAHAVAVGEHVNRDPAVDNGDVVAVGEQIGSAFDEGGDAARGRAVVQ